VLGAFLPRQHTTAYEYSVIIEMCWVHFCQDSVQRPSGAKLRSVIVFDFRIICKAKAPTFGRGFCLIFVIFEIIGVLEYALRCALLASLRELFLLPLFLLLVLVLLPYE
jgi:hypothetical protein